MDGSIEPPQRREAGDHPNSQGQSVPRVVNAAASRSLFGRLRGWLRATARVENPQAHEGSSPGRSMSASFTPVLSIIAVALAGIAALSGTMGLPGSNSGRLEAVELALKRIEMRLAPPGPSRTEAANATTLLVATQFLVAAAERSAPFDTALAVAISMIGEHPKIGPLLDQLLPEAAMGVPSTADLRAEFQAKLTECEKLLTEMSGRTGVYSRVSRFLGMTGPETSAEHRAMLDKLSADVADHNFGQAVQRISKLDGRLREPLEGWREKVQRRVAIDGILTELRRAAFIDLIDDAS
jgi:hypothetical protein